MSTLLVAVPAESLDGGADLAELRVGALAEEGDGHDAHDGDQGHEEGVLDERGATVGLATSLEPGADEVERGEHVRGAPCVSACGEAHGRGPLFPAVEVSTTPYRSLMGRSTQTGGGPVRRLH